jgi:hypothetical protein
VVDEGRASEARRLGAWLRAGLSLTLAALAPAALAWGPATHQLVTTRALDTLPKQLKPFYKAHRYELPSLQLEAVVPEDAPERRFQIDKLLAFPFPDLPTGEAAFKERFGEPAQGLGRLPWLVQESYARLVEAFKSGDKTRILNESDALSSLVADLHSPLALTENADGQKTGQHGLWARFCVRLPEAMERRLKVQPDTARFLDQPERFVFDVVRESYVWLDNVLYAEALARRGQAGYDSFFYEAFERHAGELLSRRLSRAAEDVGSFWYSAWTAAGRPELK